MHAENSALRRIQDRRAQERAVNAAIGNGESAALQILDLDFSFARLLRVIGDVPLEIGEGFFVRIAHDRHDEAALGSDRDADVVEMILDEIVAFDSAVEGWARL